MNLQAEAHLCSITACGMKSFGGLRGEIPCFLGRERQGAQTGEKTIELDGKSTASKTNNNPQALR